MTNTTRKSLAFFGAVGLATLLALTGCAGSGKTREDATAATSTPTASAGSTADPTPSAAASASSGTTTGGGSLRSGQCAASQLTGTVTTPAGGGAAGHQAYEIDLRNTGSSPCTLQGWPGTSFVGHGNGTQLGAAATFDRSSPHGTVTITPGSVAHATVLVADAANFPNCAATTADGFRVYPPGSTQALFVNASQLQLQACTNSADGQLVVDAIQPGS